MQVVLPGLDPIDLVVHGDKPRVLPVEFKVADDGELLPHRKDRLVQFYSDFGRRTVTLDSLRFR